ncbi:hypothetical protein EST38_g2535 [Candolleomyces aberdarensis]|uniref:Uncharacterized protein n=1 Tax=Candolleomyces aberdarensis TaxID=2316362 RepID=A0A4Q2DS65_9AGAR|nr:hypothetical protein EST38_g2535 [Candolleomyces aberdarensis]
MEEVSTPLLTGNPDESPQSRFYLIELSLELSDSGTDSESGALTDGDADSDEHPGSSLNSVSGKRPDSDLDSVSGKHSDNNLNSGEHCGDIDSVSAEHADSDLSSGNHPDSDSDSNSGSFNMTELVVMGLKDQPDGKHFPLARVSPWKWRIEQFIELPAEVEGIDIVAKSEEGLVVGKDAE